ncbi:MAG: SpoVA/SpoVAEb family sporulation membrane protein [Erysipelotrichaceae bacterium]
MNTKQFKDTALLHKSNQHRLKHAIFAFISGGVMGLSAQSLLVFYQTMFKLPKDHALSLVIVTIILITAITTGLGIYDRLAQYCGAGLFIPISGFANSLASSAMEGKSEGLIFGIGSNMFKLAGSVLTYGVVAAAVFGSIRYLLYGG